VRTSCVATTFFFPETRLIGEVLAQFPVAAGYEIHVISPLAASRYRERHGLRANSDAGASSMLADLMRTGRNKGRRSPGDTDLAAAFNVPARSHKEPLPVPVQDRVSTEPRPRAGRSVAWSQLSRPLDATDEYPDAHGTAMPITLIRNRLVTDSTERPCG
jgi:hypothetical protein